MENYEKIKVVGRGAYGTVHLCRRLYDNKLVIIKQIPVETMTKEERQAALNEVKVLSMLDHPNIIEYYENFLEDKALMIVMEYAEGGTLFDVLQQRGDNLLDEEQILEFFAQMLLSIHHIHSKQILHRDLKTQNILLDKKKQVVKIGDFGISKVLSSKSKAYTVVGTPCYISPELCEGKPYNQKSDIWALGCVLYELASLKRAFEANTLPALILKIMRGTFQPISAYYSEDLRQLILSMLHLDPNKRPHITQIMATPIVINSLLNLYTDIGWIQCKRAPRPVASGTGPGAASSQVKRPSSQMSNKSSRVSIVLDSSGGLKKPQPSSSVYCWGNGLTAPARLPIPSDDTVVTELSTGRTQKAAATKNGRLFIWETPSVGAEAMLPGAMESSQPAYIPRFLEGQSAVTIQHVSCGDLFFTCLTDRGIMMTFGSGANGCLGHGNFNDVLQAKIVEALLGYEVTQVSCGMSHVLAVTNEHEVFAWGRGDLGRLGLGTQESHTTPQQVLIDDIYQPCSVHCGIDCSIILTSDGQMLSCGSNRYNKIGLDTETNQIEEIHHLTHVTSPPLQDLRISNVAIGTSHTIALTDTKKVYSMGSNQFGQLGYHKKSSTNRLAENVQALDGVQVTHVACGDTFTVVVTEENEVLSWGKSSRGRLGRPEEDCNLPRRVDFGEDPQFTVTSISCSHGNTLIATKPLSDGC